MAARSVGGRVCTLTVAWRVFEDSPLVVAANRDEAMDRPSRRPIVIESEPRVLAPRDERAGGTWIGVNDQGVFVGITNRWTDAELAGERSRGLLVRDALDCETAAAAVDLIREAVADCEYEAFNLLVADAETCTYLEWAGDLSVRALQPGVHVIVNVGHVDDVEIPEVRREYGEAQAANARLVQDALEVDGDGSGSATAERERATTERGRATAWRRQASAWRERAGRVLADHEYGVCVHGDGYGTRSSSLVQLGEDGGYWFADGPPCETAYERVPSFLEGEL
jgi:uncharacterized protein with NRDE domain